MAKIWDRFDALDSHEQFRAAWVTDDDYHWVCPACFDDFRERFAWIVDASGATP